MKRHSVTLHRTFTMEEARVICLALERWAATYVPNGTEGAGPELLAAWAKNRALCLSVAAELRI